MFTVSLFEHRCHVWSLVTRLHACHNECDGWECDRHASEKRGMPASDNKVCVRLRRCCTSEDRKETEECLSMNRNNSNIVSTCINEVLLMGL